MENMNPNAPVSTQTQTQTQTDYSKLPAEGTQEYKFLFESSGDIQDSYELKEFGRKFELSGLDIIENPNTGKLFCQLKDEFGSTTNIKVSQDFLTSSKPRSVFFTWYTAAQRAERRKYQISEVEDFCLVKADEQGTDNVKASISLK